jgi:hypothetical protein
MTKTIDNAHTPVSIHLKRYLEKHKDICGDLDFNIIKDRKNWHQEMNATRRQFGHEKATIKGRPRHYCHYVIRPDALSKIPNNLSLKHLRLLAYEWASRAFGDYQFAIGYHYNELKDKEGNVTGRAPGYHAHIVVNVSNMVTGNKLHLSNTESKKLVNQCSGIAEELGMTRLPALKAEGKKYRKAGSHLTQAEREMLDKGIVPWKEEVRQAALAAADKSVDFAQFQSRMRACGFDTWLTKKGITFATSYKGHIVKVRDFRLGQDFVQKHLSNLYTVSQFLNFNTRAYTNIKDEIVYKSHVLDMGGGRYRHIRQSGAQEIADAIEVIERRGFKRADEIYHALKVRQDKANTMGERLGQLALDWESGETGKRNNQADLLAGASELELLRSDLIELNQTAATVTDVLEAARKAENLERRRLGLPARAARPVKVKRPPVGTKRLTLGDLGVSFTGEAELFAFAEANREEILRQREVGNNKGRQQVQRQQKSRNRQKDRDKNIDGSERKTR